MCVLREGGFSQLLAAAAALLRVLTPRCTRVDVRCNSSFWAAAVRVDMSKHKSQQQKQFDGCHRRFAHREKMHFSGKYKTGKPLMYISKFTVFQCLYKNELFFVFNRLLVMATSNAPGMDGVPLLLVFYCVLGVFLRVKSNFFETII